MNGQSSRARAGVLVGLALLLGGLSGVVTAARPGLPAPTLLDHGAQLGRGEKVILVVAGSYPTETAARVAAAGLSMGDVAGFYVDAAADYRLLGVYDQPTPDAVTIACADVLDAPADCAARGGTIRAIPEVHLRYVPIAGLKRFLAAPAHVCDRVGAPPCMAERLGRLLGPSGRLESGSWLVLSAFRTRAGAEQWMTWARDHGATPVALRALKLGDRYVGLGQEPHPDGSGPMLEPPADPDAVQR